MRAIFFVLTILLIPISIVYSQEKNIHPAIYVHSKGEYSAVTNDPKIMQALDLMIGTRGEYSRKAILGNNLTGKPVKIEFKDLSKISPRYATFDALGWKADDQLYIFINSKHKDAPPEALGSLLSHEAVHQDTNNSKNEETYAWTMEASVWLDMKNRKPALNTIDPHEYPLVNRENTLTNMLIDANYTDREIRQEVEYNPGYTGLPENSSTFKDKIKLVPLDRRIPSYAQ